MSWTARTRSVSSRFSSLVEIAPIAARRLVPRRAWFDVPIRPRLLLVSEITELEWTIKPQLEEWAEVLSFDPPGVGAEPLPAGVGGVGDLSHEVVASRALEKLDQAGWERFLVAADGWGIASAIAVASKRREQVVAMALGHAALSYSRSGPRAAINAEVYDAFTQLASQDAPGFVRHGIAQLTGGGFDEELAERMVHRLGDFGVDGWTALTAEEPFDEALLTLDCPLLLAKHEGCLLSTDEGFDDAVAALPSAETAAFEDPPSASPGFAVVLRRFCERHWAEPPSGHAQG